jgi:hypothetical protein
MAPARTSVRGVKSLTLILEFTQVSARNFMATFPEYFGALAMGHGDKQRLAMGRVHCSLDHDTATRWLEQLRSIQFEEMLSWCG